MSRLRDPREASRANTLATPVAGCCRSDPQRSDGSHEQSRDHVRGNIENLVGAAQVPLGVAGPILVNGQYAQGSFHVPFATTEGTLVSTYQYGMRAITEAGGANAY